ncbi:hypothetical protein vBSenS3_96 [Salmonella phage vB_SenS-3]|nr:hypothetical protein vBSenS3_96 [Salmonella phage vB_SenS-3]
MKILVSNINLGSLAKRFGGGLLIHVERQRRFESYTARHILCRIK